MPLTAENFIVTSAENHEVALGPVSLLELGTEATLLDVPETVQIDGESYTVTAILGPVTGGTTAPQARTIKVDSISVSKTVRTIGERAFNIERSKSMLSLGFADGSELTAIADSAFYGCNIKAIALPEGVKSIGKAAFASSKLRNFTLPESVETMGTQVFANCAVLGEMHWNSTLDAIPDSTFLNSSTSAWPVTTWQELPAQVKHIGKWAFSRSSLMRYLQESMLHEGLLTIGDSAFYGNNNLGREDDPLVLPTTLQSIGSGALPTGYFYTEASVPAVLGENAITGYLNVPLSLFGVYAEAPGWQDMNLYNMPDITDNEGNTYRIQTFRNVQLTAFANPETVYFGYNDGGVTWEGHSFTVTGYNTNAVINTVEYHLGPLCEAMPAGRYESLQRLFLSENCKDMTKPFDIPSDIEVHPLSAEPPTLNTNSSLWRVFLSDSQLEAYAADECWSMCIPNPFEVDGLILSQGWQPDGTNVWVRDTRDGDIVLPADISYEGTTYHIAGIWHINTGVTSLTITAPWTYIDDYELANLTSLKRVVLPPTIESIGQYAFAGSGLESLELPPSVRSIGQEAFRGCNKLRQLNIPEGIDTLRFATFMGSAIEELHLPASLTGIEQFALQTNMLNNITVDEGNTVFKSVDGVLFSKDGKTLVCLPMGPERRTYDIPYGTEKIVHTALRSANLRSLRVPATVTGYTRIPYGAGGMDRFNLIDNGCVVYADLTQQEVIDSLVMPGGGPRILFIPWTWREGALWARYNYDEEKVAEAMAIYNAACEKYSAVMFEDEDPGYTFTFRQEQGKPVGYYIDGITGAKKQTLVLPEQLTGGHVYYNGHSYDHYTAPVVGINAGAFAFCKDLQSVTMPSKLQLIEEGAFFGCTSLAEVNSLDAAQLDTTYTYKDGYWEYGVTTGIRPYAFANCTALTNLKANVNLGTPLMVVGCDNMKELSLETKENMYEVDGIYYYVSTHYVGTDAVYDNVLYYYPAGREETELTVADSIHGIGFCAFAGSRLEKVTLPSSVQEISSAAFWRNQSLKELVLTTNDPDSIPAFITTEGTTSLSQNYNYRLYTTVPGYGAPYKYTGIRSQTSNLTYIEQTEYPSFDADYTRENTMVKMSAEALQKLEEYEQNGWPVHTDRYGRTSTNRSNYEALLATFKGIEEGTVTGISSEVVTPSASAKAIYSLSGQRLSKPRRGLNIINGRKVVVR